MVLKADTGKKRNKLESLFLCVFSVDGIYTTCIVLSIRSSSTYSGAAEEKKYRIGLTRKYQQSRPWGANRRNGPSATTSRTQPLTSYCKPFYTEILPPFGLSFQLTLAAPCYCRNSVRLNLIVLLSFIHVRHLL